MELSNKKDKKTSGILLGPLIEFVYIEDKVKYKEAVKKELFNCLVRKMLNNEHERKKNQLPA